MHEFGVFIMYPNLMTTSNYANKISPISTILREKIADEGLNCEDARGDAVLV